MSLKVVFWGLGAGAPALAHVCLSLPFRLISVTVHAPKFQLRLMIFFITYVLMHFLIFLTIHAV